MHIAVIGSGYVGLVTGTCFAEFGDDVTCVDVDAEKIARLARGEITVYEPGLNQLVKKNLQAGRLRFTTDIGSATEQSLVVFLAVGTPPKADGAADLTYVEGAAREISEHLDSYKVIATKSTVPVGTGRRLASLIREHLPKPLEFSVVSNPEFLREGAAISDFMRPDRVVIGGDDEQAIAIMRDLYRPLYLIETPFVITSLEGAELIKYAANAFLATKISFVNEIANLCEKVGCDVHEVARAIGMDRRIGAAIGREFSSPMRIVDAVIEVNEQQRLSMVPKIETLAGGLQGKRIAVLGLAFKPETDDMRDAPSVEIIRGLIHRGATVSAYDPVGRQEGQKIMPEIEFAEDEYVAAAGADVLVFMTEWNQFRALDMERIRSLMRVPRIADLRNIYEPDDMRNLGFEYVGVGR
ncbi:MAG: UDP-glucose 6-dehydrogenase [Verrucomicrobia bacterium]|nr:MAG: UDP-glucose 6-dehydrogenase [Verrucomicrobiota bacterium]